MYRFYEVRTGELRGQDRFQYIICIGSTENIPERIIRHLKFQYIICIGSTQQAKELRQTKQ